MGEKGADTTLYISRGAVLRIALQHSLEVETRAENVCVTFDENTSDRWIGFSHVEGMVELAQHLTVYGVVPNGPVHADAQKSPSSGDVCYRCHIVRPRCTGVGRTRCVVVRAGLTP